jgi:putative hydrolase of the HAD superfamily
MNNRPRAVVFDFGGTIMDDTFSIPDGCRHLYSLLQDPTMTFDEYMRADTEIAAALGDRRAESELEHSAVCFARLLRDYLGLTYEFDAEQEAREFFRAAETWIPVEGAVQVVRSLHESGVPLAVLSNMVFSGEQIRQELAGVGIDQCFQRVVTSADYGVRKPNPLPFCAVAGRLGVRPDECWYIGDTLATDIVGAKRSDMIAVWLNRHGTVDEIDAAPDLEIRDWAEFERVWHSTG